MGKKAIHEYFRLVMLMASLLVMVLTFMGLYGGDDIPTKNTVSAALTFILPGLCVANVFFIIYWLYRRRIFILLPLLTLIACYRYIGTILQISSSPDLTTPHITVASYNVRMFNDESTCVLAQDILNLLVEQETDIICFQEFRDYFEGETGKVTSMLSEVFPYHAKGKDDMTIYSKYPIKNSKSFPFEYSNNSFMWADIELGNSKTIRVFNVHMETTGINSTLHSVEKMKTSSLQNDTLGVGNINNGQIYEAILGNYVFSLAVRSGQSSIVANEKRNSPYPIILCGDFNDVPYSYTYHTLLGDLNDGFKEAGHGFMYTYRGAKGIFRIDYIFNDSSIKCLDYFSLDKDFSDHNPVFSRLEL